MLYRYGVTAIFTPILAMGIAFVGCGSTNYEYMPVAAARLTSADVPSGPVPVTQPLEPARPGSGSVRLVVLGRDEVTSVDGRAKVPAIRVRMTLSNPSDRTWSIDGAEQRIELASGRDRVAVYAMTPEGGRAPMVDALPRRETAVDLYYPFPPREPDEAHLARFDVVWTVQSADGSTRSGRVPFERVIVTPPISKDREAPGSYFSSPFNAEGSFWPPQDAVGYPPDMREYTFPNPR